MTVLRYKAFPQLVFRNGPSAVLKKAQVEEKTSAFSSTKQN